MEAEIREEQRFENGTFVGPGTRGAVDEGFFAVNVSRRGMALQRVRRRFRRAGDHDLDHGFCWIAVPLPGRGRHLKALAEVLRADGVPFGVWARPDEGTCSVYVDLPNNGIAVELVSRVFDGAWLARRCADSVFDLCASG